METLVEKDPTPCSFKGDWCDTFKLVSAILSSILFLGLSTALFVLLFAYQGAKPDTPCAGLWGPITYLHRGNLTFAQENTFDAIVNGSVLSQSNPEMDVSIISDGTAVLFHDESLLRMTGIADKTIKDVESVEALPVLLQEVDGYMYSSTNIIPQLAPVVEAMCDANEDIGMNFDTKAIGGVKGGVSALQNSKCSKGNTSDNVIWSTPYPGIVTSARKELDAAGYTNRIGLYMPPGAYSFWGLKLMLKTRVLHSAFSTGSSILVLHKTVFDKEEELIQSWIDDGWCTGIYGITPEEVSNYTADYYVIDEGPTFPNLPFGGYGGDGEPMEVVYNDDSLTSYNGMIAGAFLFLIASLLLAAYCIVKWRSMRQARGRNG